jgi:hypothetical protein
MAFLSRSSTFSKAGEEPYPSLAFDANIEAPVRLIEIESDGSSSRVDVSEKLIERHIEKDFGVSSQGVRIIVRYADDDM